jgi:hypothetical protein
MALTDKEWRSIKTCARMLAKQSLSPPKKEIRDELLRRFWLGEFGSARHPINLLDDCPEQDQEGQPYALLSPEDMLTAYRMYGHARSIEELVQKPYKGFDKAYRKAYLAQIELNSAAVSQVMIESKSPLPKLERPKSAQSSKEAERVCEEWLRVCIEQKPERPHNKSYFRDMARKQLPALGRRGFDRAWDRATEGAPEWRKPGPH